jgi:DNA polymerase-3 subunit alpha
LFCDGRTAGIFQFESSGMKDILCKLQPSRFEDLIALNALYRPGPLQGGMIDDFIDRRHGRVKVSYELPELEEILKETYGVIVYQEQVMQIASVLGGFSLGEADLLRRAMGKKKKKVMEAQRKKFLDGANERNLDGTKARRIFELMEQFAGYGFNKSHSTAYALLAYQTAYLKAHYPVQFMAALLTSEMSNTDKVVQYLKEAHEMGISVLHPDVNSGEVCFLGSKEGHINFGLAAVKNVGESATKSILSARDEVGEFKSFYEFFEEVDLRSVNKRVVEALIKCGAFDSIYPKRKSLFEILDRAMDQGHKVQRDRLSGQQGLFDSSPDDSSQAADMAIPDHGEWRDREKWSFEKETLGFYLTGHPLQKYEFELQSFSRFSTSQITDEMGGKDVSIGGMVAGVRQLRTRKGDAMAVIQLEDMEGTIEVLLWPNVYESYREQLESEFPVLVRGRCDVDARGDIKLICSEVLSLASVWKEAVEKACIRIPVSAIEEPRILEFDALLRRFRGKCSVEFELYQQNAYTVHLIPAESVDVNPGPEFVQEVERLFGEKSCILEIHR